ncbi:MAG: calcium-binding protein, partial [Cyanobacteria bacterium P01_F01_bin.143]
RDIIQDYQDGFDLLDLTGGLSFGSLTINQNGANTDILETATNEILATLIGIDATAIDNSDFV